MSRAPSRGPAGQLLTVLRRDWPRLLIELVVLVAGITISFALEEWRVRRELHESERRVWRTVRENLVADTLDLTRRIGFIESMIGAYGRLERGARDSLDHDMDLAISYVGFMPTDHGYLEIRERGASRILSRELLARLSSLHNGRYANTREWDTITRDFILQRMIPYVDMNSPAVPTGSNGGIATGFGRVYDAVGARDQFRNLMRTNRLFKDAQLMTYRMALSGAREMIGQVDGYLGAD